jgi:hypothetical protein
MTTLTHIVKERSIDSVEFLKIDVEGFDFSVLKGFPWEMMKPKVIECEFEDRKTRPMGHGFKDVCEYLTQKGYIVYISEWHPIIRYGIRHQWKGIFRYNNRCSLSENAWGNILAFLVNPETTKFEAAISRSLRFHDLVDNFPEQENNQLTIAFANKLYRDGQFQRALEAYKALFARNGVYQCLNFNIDLCKKQLSGHRPVHGLRPSCSMPANL